MADIVYSLGVEGQQLVLGTLKSVEDGVERGGKKAVGLADAFKMVSRDASTLGGQMAQTFSHAIDEAVSLAEVLGKGGLLAQAGLLSLGVAGIAFAWKEVVAASKEASERQAKALKDIDAEVARVSGLMADRRRDLTNEDVAQINDRTIAAEGLLVVKGAELRSINDQLAAFQREIASRSILQTLTSNAVADLGRENALRTKQAELIGQIQALQGTASSGASQTAAARERALDDAAQKAKDERDKKAREAARQAAEKAQQEELARQKRHNEAMIREGNDFALRQEQLANEEQAQRDDAALADEIARAKEEAELEQFFADENRKAGEESERVRQADIAGYAALDKASNDVRLAYEEEKRALEELTRAKYLNATADAAMGAAMMAVGPIIDLMTSKLSVLGEINRENYQDKLKFTEDLPDILAKEAQAVLAGIAIQAAGEAAKHGAAAAGELAFGFGALAIGSPTSAAHFESAAMHGISAGMYAAIAGGSGAAAFGVGMQRGDGGLFGLTDEEREAQKREKEAKGGGVSAGRIGGGSRGGGDPSQTVVNINVGGGGIFAGDDRRTADTIARGVRSANRDGFHRRRMAMGS